MLVTSRGFARGVLGLHADDITFSVSKLFFAYGLGNGMYFPFSVGAATVLNPEKTKVSHVIDIVAQYRPTAFFAVPTFYGALLREAESGARVDLSSLRLAVSAGEMLPAAIFEKFRQRFGLEILDGIGSTEMLHMFLSSRPGKARAGSCGFPVPGYEAKIVDDEGREVLGCAQGREHATKHELEHGCEIGNLWVRGLSALAEYWGKPELTARTKREGNWVVTGDKFTRDAEGYYHYCGRSDDMLKVAGMWVSPMEVENALLGHPDVAEAAVVGVADANGLTYEVAYIVLAAGLSGSEALAQQLCEYVKAKLISYKCPREVRFCPELPKTATGKIQRFKLRGLET
jgi:benzoate-CoA ligase